MSIITYVAVAIVAGFIVFIKTLNAEKNANHPQLNCKEGEKLMDSKTDDNDDDVQEVRYPETWTDEYGVVFSGDKRKLIKAPKQLKEYIIPEGTISIEARAFKSSQIESVHIPNSVTRIKFGAFAWCDKLVIEIPDSVRKVDNEAFLFVKEVRCYGPLKEKGPWRAKKFITEKKKDTEENRNNAIKQKQCIPNYGGLYMDYVGEVENGVPHGKGGIYNRMSMSPYPIEEGLYVNGKLNSGRVYNSDGESFAYSASDFDEHGRRNGYGTGFDSKGKLYTGKWVNGYTEEEFGEIWHDIN